MHTGSVRRLSVAHVDGIMLAMLIGSLGLNVYLGATRNATRRTNIHELIMEGAHAPKFEGTTLKGLKTQIDYGKDDKETLLYVFSPTCHWCQKNQENIRAIVRTRPDLHIFGVMSGSVDRGAASAEAEPFPEIVTPTLSTARAYGFGGTPATILISPSGKVLKSWSGAYVGTMALDISRTLGITLPGLSD